VVLKLWIEHHHAIKGMMGVLMRLRILHIMCALLSV
jgi:hypothetical protein